MSIVDANLMVAVPPIVTVCNLCAEAVAKLHPSTEVDQYVTLYCEHNQVGALFLPALGFWQVRTPSSLQDWTRQWL